VIGGSPTGALTEDGLPYFDSTLACVMPRVGRPSDAEAEAPLISSVSALAVPQAAKSKAISDIFRQLAIVLLHHMFIFRVIRL
jgi:hypothetical protein